MNLMSLETNLDPFGGSLDVVPAHQVERYIADRVRTQMHKAKSPAIDIDATGLECLEDSPEKVFLRANPSLKAAVDAGRMSVRIDGGKTTIALAKSYTPTQARIAEDDEALSSSIGF